MPEFVKTMPVARKFHEMMRRNSAPTAMTARSSVKPAISAWGRH
jgi:hypothetical protein|tara:strand:- start:129 stop:260 length:132 start_codon:yes stop_codon:yes gene_type:complete